MIAILTGDIIKSKDLSKHERHKFLDLLESIPSVLSPLSKSIIEIFRGDSFQLKIDNVLESLKVAITIRALIRSYCFEKSHKQWDVRLSLGLGQSEFEKESLGLSDGEAFRNSGYRLDTMKKSRLALTTPWPEINSEFKILTAFADDIISNWTQKQSHVMFLKLKDKKSNTEISEKLEITRQAADKLLRGAREQLIYMYDERFKKLVADKL